MKIPIFVINLKKDIKRKQMMIEQFVRFNIQNYIFVDAVDGINYDKTKYNVQIMHNWSDPIFNRNVNHGEIGCFISHYQIWEKIVADKLNAAIILEDDNIFNSDFMMKIQYILEINFKLYDLFYLSRIKVNPNIIEEQITNIIVIPSYSYNTNAYILTFSGANKLLNTPCIQNLIPVDEFLPIMYCNNYPHKQYTTAFMNCDKLISFACIDDITRQESRKLFPSNIIDSDIFNPIYY